LSAPNTSCSRCSNWKTGWELADLGIDKAATETQIIDTEMAARRLPGDSGDRGAACGVPDKAGRSAAGEEAATFGAGQDGRLRSTIC